MERQVVGVIGVVGVIVESMLSRREKGSVSRPSLDVDDSFQRSKKLPLTEENNIGE